MFVGRSRCLSWEEGEPGQHAGQLQEANGAAAEGNADLPVAAAASPPLLPPPLPPQQLSRDEEVAQLQAYLEGLSGSQGDRSLQFPEAFPALVQRAMQQRRDECAAARGWVPAPVAAAQDLADAQATATAAGAALLPAGAALDKLGAALAKMRQLEGALAAADKRAAVVAAAGRELERQSGAAEGAGRTDDDSDPACSTSGGDLQEAMARERRRLQHEAQLLQALQEDQIPAEAAEGTATPGVGDSYGAGQMTREQEALLEALLGQPEAAVSPSNPYAIGCSEMATIDAQLAALGGGSEGAGILGPAPTAGLTAAQQHQQQAVAEEQEEEQDDAMLDAARSSYQRAQEEARTEAQHLKRIDVALRALRTGIAAPAAAC